MRYGFSCECGQEQEVTCSWAERPASLPCACGGVASPRITGGRDLFVKGKELTYDQRYTIPNMGWRVGRTNQEQHQIYENIVGRAKKIDREQRKSLARKSEDRFERVAKVPLEIHEYVTEMTGDPCAFSRDPEYWAKATNTWTGE